jgi:uncharacterized integral membrane protein
VSTPQPPGIPDQPTPTSQSPEAAAPEPADPPLSAPSAEEDRPSNWQPLLYLKVGLLLFAIAYSTAFVFENTNQIRIDFVFSTARVRLIWEILLLLALGLVGGILLSQLYRHRRRAQLSKESRKSRDSRQHLRRRHKAVGKSS